MSSAEAQTLQLKAYAKINLGLDVVKRLPNGYHQVKMIMQTVGIYDELTFEKREQGISITTDSGELPTDENNLIYKAAKLMVERFGLSGGVKIHLCKHIPIAAGMAGGSTDAAATLLGINALYQMGIPKEELQRESVAIGADVPFCVLGGTALSEGIGEILTPIEGIPELNLLIAKPDLNVSTKYVYEHLDAEGVKKHPDIDGMTEAIRQGNLQGILDRMENVLEGVTIPAHPVIAEIKGKMLEYGALQSMMSGSGPTVFGIYPSREKATQALEQLQQTGLAKQLFVTGIAPTKDLK